MKADLSYMRLLKKARSRSVRQHTTAQTPTKTKRQHSFQTTLNSLAQINMFDQSLSNFHSVEIYPTTTSTERPRCHNHRQTEQNTILTQRLVPSSHSSRILYHRKVKSKSLKNNGKIQRINELNIEQKSLVQRPKSASMKHGLRKETRQRPPTLDIQKVTAWGLQRKNSLLSPW